MYASTDIIYRVALLSNFYLIVSLHLEFEIDRSIIIYNMLLSKYWWNFFWYAGVKPFQCVYCSSGYAEKRNLMNHITRYANIWIAAMIILTTKIKIFYGRRRQSVSPIFLMIYEIFHFICFLFNKYKRLRSEKRHTPSFYTFNQ